MNIELNIQMNPQIQKILVKKRNKKEKRQFLIYRLKVKWQNLTKSKNRRVKH